MVLFSEVLVKVTVKQLLSRMDRSSVLRPRMCFNGPVLVSPLTANLKYLVVEQRFFFPHTEPLKSHLILFARNIPPT